MKTTRKKIGTLMEERLLYEARKAALEKGIPFHRFVEEAVENYLTESKRKPAKAKRSASAGVAEKSPAYQARSDGSPPPASITDSAQTAAAFAIPLEERWDRVLGTAGKYRSGRSDISVRHNDFAADAFKE
jgi:hypothetical protein